MTSTSVPTVQPLSATSPELTITSPAARGHAPSTTRSCSQAPDAEYSRVARFTPPGDTTSTFAEAVETGPPT